MTWTNLTAESFLTPDMVTAINNETTTLAMFIVMRLGWQPPLVLPEVVRGTLTVPTAEFVNRIERNIDSLARDIRHMVPATKTWLGEDRDAEFLSYKDVNRWAESLGIIRAWVLTFPILPGWNEAV